MTNKIRPFHLAFPVNNIQETITWYTSILGCTIGRQADKWVDFNFFNHQISAHKANSQSYNLETNSVDGHNIPIRHFGIILNMTDWELLVEKLKLNKITFLIEPNIRFKNEKGEQATLFIKDPSGNVLEFKAFQYDEMIFES